MGEADIIKEYLVSLGFDVDESSFAAFKSQLGGLMLAAGTIGAAVLGLAGTVTSYVTKAAAGLDELHDFAELVDVDTESLAELEHVAENADSSVGAVRSSLRGVSEALGGVALKLPRAVKLFERLHLDAYDSNGELKTATDLLDDVSARVRDMPRPKALRFLSSLGIDPTMLKVLTGDWAEFRMELRRVNAVLGVDMREAAKAGDAYTGALKRLWGIIGAIYNGISVRLMPRLTRSFDNARQRIMDNLGRIADLITPVLNGILDAADDVVTLIMDGVHALDEFTAWLRELDDATGGWAKTILLAAIAWKILNSEFMQSETGRLMKLAGILALLYDDYKAWTEGRKSLIDWGGWMGTILRYLIQAWGYWQLFKIGIGIFFSLAMAALGFAASIALIVAQFILANRLFGWLVKITEGYKWLNRGMKVLWAVTLADDILIVIGLLWAYYRVMKSLWDNWDNVWAGYAAAFRWIGQQFVNLGGVIASWATSTFTWLGAQFSAMGDVIANWATTGAQKVLDAWQGVKDWFAGWFTWFGEKASAAGDFFTPDFARAAPAMAAAGAGGNFQQSVSMKQEFYIDGSGSPEATTRAVAGAQRSAAADAAAAFRPPAR